MPILDLQQRLVEVGRIRMGQKNDRNLPTRLNTWRLTSQDKERLAVVAEVYGGEVVPWENEFEVVTTSAVLRILVMPGHALTQWWEMWSGGGCQRRCDGFQEVISGGPCLCPSAMDERTAGAKANPPTACRPTTRLSVLLPDIPGIGHWRLETHGFYAAVELAGTAGLLQMATAQGQVLPARLRIDQRHKVEGGQTTRWNVPVIDIDALLPDVMALHEAPVGAYTPMERAPGATLGTGLKALEEARTAPPATRANAQEPIPPAPPRMAAPEPPPDEPMEPVAEPPAPAPQPAPIATVMISEAQRRLLFATANELGLDEANLRSKMQSVLGVESTKEIPAARFEELLTAVREYGEFRQSLGLGGEPEPAAAEPPPVQEPAAPEPPAPEPLAEPEPEAESQAQGSAPEPADDPIAIAKATVLGPEFTRYAGKTIYDVATTDPTYLAWLASPVIKDDVVRGAAQAMAALGG